MSEKLKPCPFCGGEAEIITMRDDTDEYETFVGCPHPKCGVGFYYAGNSEPVAKWNTRAEIPKAWWERLKASLETKIEGSIHSYQEERRWALGEALEEIDRIERGE